MTKSNCDLITIFLSMYCQIIYIYCFNHQEFWWIFIELIFLISTIEIDIIISNIRVLLKLIFIFRIIILDNSCPIFPTNKQLMNLSTVDFLHKEKKKTVSCGPKISKPIYKVYIWYENKYIMVTTDGKKRMFVECYLKQNCMTSYLLP